MTLSQDRLVRYSRNIKLPEIGERGQQRLLSSSVLVIGAGGLGSPIALYLAASGVGKIGIIDGDKVELSNLQRQIIHETSDIKRNKVDSAKDSIHDLNPEIEVITFDFRLDENNAAKIISGYDIIVDGSDNFETRFMVNDVCYELKKPLISGAINRFDGQVYTFKSYQEGKPCYRCIYPEVPPAGTMPNCSEHGVIGAIAGVVGSMQATEVIKELLGIGESLAGFMIVIDALNNNYRKVKVNKDKNCKTCG